MRQQVPQRFFQKFAAVTAGTVQHRVNRRVGRVGVLAAEAVALEGIELGQQVRQMVGTLALQLGRHLAELVEKCIAVAPRRR